MIAGVNPVMHVNALAVASPSVILHTADGGAIKEGRMMDRASKPVTIGDLRRAGRRLWCYCEDCGREVEKDLNVWRALDDAVEVPSAGKHLKCSQCGSGRVSTRPQLHEKPIKEIRAVAREKQARQAG